MKKRRFKYRIILYAFIIFLGYQISYNLIMNVKLATSNKSFVEALLMNSNYYVLYEKKSENLFTSFFSNIVDVNKPVSIIDNVFHLKQNNYHIAYVENPNIDTSSVEKEPEVYIYNTHQGESYTGKGLSEYNITPGVMMASYLLQKKLLESDVKSIVMEDNLIDYMNVNNMNHAKSYMASRKFLEEALREKNYKLIIDIHRDSISHEKSTININNKMCAKILFVIGEEYDSYKENLNKANIINEKIKEKYPDLTRGIITKGGKGNNGIYNQDLNSNIILMEIGSDTNTIEEVVNTIDLIGPVIGDYINE